MLSSSVSSWVISPSSGFSSGSTGVDWYPPLSLFARLISSVSTSAISSRLFCVTGMVPLPFSLFGGHTGDSSFRACSTNCRLPGLMFWRLIISENSRMPPRTVEVFRRPMFSRFSFKNLRLVSECYFHTAQL